MIYRKIIVLVLLSFFANFASADDNIKHNPFEKLRIETNPTNNSTPYQKRKNSELILHGTVTAGPESVANINGDIVKIGHSYRGYRLMGIFSNKVLLRKNEKVLVLTPLNKIGNVDAQ